MSWFRLSVLALLSSCYLPSLILPEREQPDLLFTRPSPRPELGQFQITGYLPVYSLATVEPARLEYLTDLVYFAATPGKDGAISMSTGRRGDWYKVKKWGQQYQLRLHLGVKDLGDLPYEQSLARICADVKLRQRFGVELTRMALEQGFVGVDIDWEYPRGASLHDFVTLLSELRQLFDPHGLKLSVAVSPYAPLLQESYRYVDQVHLMSYDDVGLHSSYEKTRQHLKMILRQVPAHRVVLGLPFYGRIAVQRGTGPALSYRDIVSRYSPTSDQDEAGGYHFNGPQTIARKTRLARRLGLGGVMIWQVGQDDAGEHSLLKTISDTNQEYFPFISLRSR